MTSKDKDMKEKSPPHLASSPTRGEANKESLSLRAIMKQVQDKKWEERGQFI